MDKSIRNRITVAVAAGAVLAAGITGAAVLPAYGSAASGATHAQTVSHAPAHVKQDINYVKLSATQTQNFAVVYCLNVAKKGQAETQTEFAQVASQDAISPTQQSVILALASENC